MPAAKDLMPGETYRSADGTWRTIVNCWSSGLRTYIQHSDGHERILFPNTWCELAPDRTLADVEECIPVVYLADEDGRALSDVLFNVEGVVAHGMTIESAHKVLDELLPWMTPGMDTADSPGLGDADQWMVLEDRWLVSGNLGLGYVALAEVTRWALPS
jgi:hypothetical protein